MPWWKTAKPGDEVVCIQNPYFSSRGMLAAESVRVGETYVIKAVCLLRDLVHTEENNDLVMFDLGLAITGRAWHDATLFKPVEKTKRKTDISVFNEILRTAKVPTTEEA